MWRDIKWNMKGKYQAEMMVAPPPSIFQSSSASLSCPTLVNGEMLSFKLNSILIVDKTSSQIIRLQGKNSALQYQSFTCLLSLLGRILDNPIQHLNFNLLTISCHLNPFYDIDDMRLLLHWQARSVLFLVLQPAEKVGKHEGESEGANLMKGNCAQWMRKRAHFKGLSFEFQGLDGELCNRLGDFIWTRCRSIKRRHWMQIGWMLIQRFFEQVTWEYKCLCSLRLWDLDSETGFLIKIENSKNMGTYFGVWRHKPRIKAVKHEKEG